MKIRYLNDELRETHNDYRAELAQLARQISETKHKDVTDNETYVLKIDELNTKLAQTESTSRSLKRQLDELKLDNEKDAGTVTNDNKKLRSGLADAVAKIERYKNEAEHSKEMCEEMAEQLGVNEERINKLEDEVMNLEETLREKEKLEEYLQSQVKAKDMPKLSRRSTLLRTPSESSLEVVDPVIVEELENEKSVLLKELEEKKKGDKSRPGSTLRTSSPPRESWQGLPVEIRVADILTPAAEELAKKKRCAHCGIIVHSQCSKRVVNTCGLPDQCANYYLDSHSAPNGRMNGWVRLFREWQSAWGEMDEKRLAFYDNDSVQTDLRKPFLTVDLEKELRIVRVGSEVPVKMENGQRNILYLAPSIATAKAMAEALQSASTRRMMLTRRPSSFSEQSCLLVLSKPNNLTIHTTCVVDDYLLIGAQSGLFFTSVSSARVPVRIAGFNSVTAMECLADLNILALIIDHKRSLALVPLPALKLALNVTHPSVHADVISGYDHLHAIAYHLQDGQR
ncbi:hypothetical protein COOONC_05349 [Cooperia oncophora]